MNAHTRWQRPSGDVLAWHTWGPYSVVFDPASGDTHLMDEIAAEALLCIGQEAFGEAVLCRSLSGRLRVEPDEAMRKYAAAFLRRCDELGLLERVPS